MEQIAAFLNYYNMTGQHSADRNMTRYKHDVSALRERNEIATGPGRWALGTPENALSFAPNSTIINQKWGAAHVMTSTKTDVESDLRNVARPSARVRCGQYEPEQGAALAADLVAMPETSFRQFATQQIDPTCTARATGINRWEWLPENPQERVMVPFEFLVDSRHQAKDAVYHNMDKPLEYSVAARERRFICGKVFVDPAVPVERAHRREEPKSFTNTLHSR
jgi:hypothetical protein